MLPAPTRNISETNTISATDNIPHSSWKLESHYTIHSNMDLIRGQAKPYHTVEPQLFLESVLTGGSV